MGFGHSKLVLDAIETGHRVHRPAQAVPHNIVLAEDGRLCEVGAESILNSTDAPPKIMSQGLRFLC